MLAWLMARQGAHAAPQEPEPGPSSTGRAFTGSSSYGEKQFNNVNQL